MSTTSSTRTADTDTETKRWLSAWARSTLRFPTCTGPIGAIALWRSIQADRGAK